MTNTSATGGYLGPAVTTPPTEDGDLDAQLQAMVVGITGLDGTLVRPRWQPTDPKQPERTVNWCSIGEQSSTPDDGPYIHHNSGTGIDDLTANDEVQRHEIIEVLASFYGPNCYSYACLLRDGLSVGQNRETLTAQGIGLVSVGKCLSLPEILNQGWIRRVDLPITLRRINARNYPILNIRSSSGQIEADRDGTIVVTLFDVEPLP